MKPIIDLFLLCGLLWGGPHGPPPTSAPIEDEVDLSHHMGRYEGCFVMLDAAESRYVRHNPRRCAERFSPCSTFKIPNSLISLETGVLSDADYELKWNGVKGWREITNQDHTLRSAFKHSVVWYYQRAAEMVGKKRMQQWLDRLDYGNRDMSAGLTQFWLGRSLKISADEQVAFLLRLHRGDLALSTRSQRIVKDIMVLSGEGGWVLRGKTGTNADEGRTVLGWFVGYLTNGERTYVFALNIEGRDGATGVRASRICRSILDELLPAYKAAREKDSPSSTSQPAADAAPEAPAGGT